MKKWNLIVDVAKCTNCNLCTLANQDEHVGNEFEGYSAPMPRHGSRWIDIRSNERGSGPVMDVAYLPVMCQHCDDAPCMKAAKNGAVTKRADGIVHIHPVKAKGQKAIADACPYGAVRWNEELQLPQHWFFDAHLIDRGWKEPRCATSVRHRRAQVGQGNRRGDGRDQVPGGPPRAAAGVGHQAESPLQESRSLHARVRRRHGHQDRQRRNRLRRRCEGQARELGSRRRRSGHGCLRRVQDRRSQTRQRTLSGSSSRSPAAWRSGSTSSSRRVFTSAESSSRPDVRACAGVELSRLRTPPREHRHLLAHRRLPLSTVTLHP